MPHLSSPPDRLQEVLYSKLDPNRVADSNSLPNEVLVREIEAVLDHLLDSFPHWHAEERLESKGIVLQRLISTDRNELVADIREHFPERQRPFGQRVVQCLIFCLLGTLTIVATPIVWASMLVDRVAGRKGQHAEDPDLPRYCTSSQFEALCEGSRIWAASIWPAKQVECYCCERKS